MTYLQSLEETFEYSDDRSVLRYSMKPVSCWHLSPGLRYYVTAKAK